MKGRQPPVCSEHLSHLVWMLIVWSFWGRRPCSSSHWDEQLSFLPQPWFTLWSWCQYLSPGDPHSGNQTGSHPSKGKINILKSQSRENITWTYTYTFLLLLLLEIILHCPWFFTSLAPSLGRQTSDSGPYSLAAGNLERQIYKMISLCEGWFWAKGANNGAQILLGTKIYYNAVGIRT